MLGRSTRSAHAPCSQKPANQSERLPFAIFGQDIGSVLELVECIDKVLNRALELVQRWAGEFNSLLDGLSYPGRQRYKVRHDRSSICSMGVLLLVLSVGAELDYVGHADQ